MDLLLIYKPDTEQYTILEQALLSGLSPMDWQIEWGLYLANDPNNGVKGRLEQLLRAMVKSPEFQLM